MKFNLIIFVFKYEKKTLRNWKKEKKYVYYVNM